MTAVEITVKRTHDAKASRAVDFLVDSGAMYSVAPSSVLKALGGKPYRSRSFFLADGTKVTRQIGDAYFKY